VEGIQRYGAAQWDKVCNYDLDVIEGRRTELESQRYYGYAAEKAKSEVDAWLSKLM
jgi:hypothetical protein